MTAAAIPAQTPPFDNTLIERKPDGNLELLGWRCEGVSPGHLAFGERRICPLCGSRQGHITYLSHVAELETWTTVSTKTDAYTIAYCLLGDGADEQVVRVLGPVPEEYRSALRSGMPMDVAFSESEIGGRPAVHHVFRPRAAGEGDVDD